MRNIVLEIAYDGTPYSGWQIQNNAVTIQGIIEDKLQEIIQEQVRVLVAGRTDAKVHALGQIASFKTNCRISDEQIKCALNSMIPRDIRVLRVFEVPMSFHPRYSAKKRWYRYIISNGPEPIPFFKNFALWIRRSINIALLNEYSDRIIGVHDFTSFATLEDRESPEREVYECSVTRKNDFIILDIVANSFLRKMVRTIVGTFLELEKEQAGPERVTEILKAKDRSAAGKTAYPGGLYLVKIFY